MFNGPRFVRDNFNYGIIDDAAHTEIADQYCSVDSSLFKNMIPRGRVGPHWRVQFLLRLGAVYVF